MTRSTLRPRTRQLGAALWFALLILTLLALLGAVSSESLLLSIRSTRGAIRNAEFFHLVEMALVRCEARLLNDTKPAVPTAVAEPRRWRNRRAFSPGQPGVTVVTLAFAQREVEAWCLTERFGALSGNEHAYLVTARLAPERSARQRGAWLQRLIKVRRAVAGLPQWHSTWRIVAEPPEDG